MSTRRIVVQHDDLRRLTIDEDEWDNPDANPLNWANETHVWDSDRNTTVLRHHPAKPVDDWLSLKQMGFKPYAYIHPAKCDKTCTHETNVDVHAGHEIRLEQ